MPPVGKSGQPVLVSLRQQNITKNTYRRFRLCKITVKVSPQTELRLVSALGVLGKGRGGGRKDRDDKRDKVPFWDDKNILKWIVVT